MMTLQETTIKTTDTTDSIMKDLTDNTMKDLTDSMKVTTIKTTTLGGSRETTIIQAKEGHFAVDTEVIIAGTDMMLTRRARPTGRRIEKRREAPADRILRIKLS